MLDNFKLTKYDSTASKNKSSARPSSWLFSASTAMKKAIGPATAPRSVSIHMPARTANRKVIMPKNAPSLVLLKVLNVASVMRLATSPRM